MKFSPRYFSMVFTLLGDSTMKRVLLWVDAAVLDLGVFAMAELCTPSPSFLGEVDPDEMQME
jgi:hypothetical protein